MVTTYLKMSDAKRLTLRQAQALLAILVEYQRENDKSLQSLAKGLQPNHPLKEFRRATKEGIVKLKEAIDEAHKKEVAFEQGRNQLINAAFSKPIEGKGAT